MICFLLYMKHVKLIYDIRSLLSYLGRTSVTYNSRSSNNFADSLVKKGSTMDGDSVIWSLDWCWMWFFCFILPCCVFLSLLSDYCFLSFFLGRFLGYVFLRVLPASLFWGFVVLFLVPFMALIKLMLLKKKVFIIFLKYKIHLLQPHLSSTTSPSRPPLFFSSSLNPKSLSSATKTSHLSFSNPNPKTWSISPRRRLTQTTTWEDRLSLKVSVSLSIYPPNLNPVALH